MEIFLTGGTGFIGRALIAELKRAGHGVVALNRSPEKRAQLSALGALPHDGDLLDGSSYLEAASRADAVVHAAFDYRAAVDGDVTALDTLLAATADAGSHLVYTSGCWVVGDTKGEVFDDDAPTDHPASIVAWRVAQESKALAQAGARRTATVLRPGVVYGGAGGLTARMFATAQRDGAAAYVGDGTNHWSMIHVDDLAAIYRIAVEARHHGVVQAVDGRPLAVATVAAAASQAAGGGGATTSISLDAAREKIGPVADAMCLDQHLAATAARWLGWKPVRRSFETAAPAAFAEWQAVAGDKA